MTFGSDLNKFVKAFNLPIRDYTRLSVKDKQSAIQDYLDSLSSDADERKLKAKENFPKLLAQYKKEVKVKRVETEKGGYEKPKTSPPKPKPPAPPKKSTAPILSTPTPTSKDIMENKRKKDMSNVINLTIDNLIDNTMVLTGNMRKDYFDPSGIGGFNKSNLKGMGQSIAFNPQTGQIGENLNRGMSPFTEKILPHNISYKDMMDDNVYSELHMEYMTDSDSD